MSYDQRTRRTTRLRTLRYLLAGVLALLALAALLTFFSLARYSNTRTLVNKETQSEFSEPSLASIAELNKKIPLVARIPDGAENSWLLVSSKTREQRQAQINQILLREKRTKISLSAGTIAIVSQQLDSWGNAKFHKRAAIMLPGESLEIPLASLEASTKQLGLRCLGATVDRRDLPAKVSIAFSSPTTTTTEELKISSSGEPGTAGIPNNATNIKAIISWPADQPGLLVVDGELPFAQTRGELLFFANIDTLASSTAELSETVSSLKRSLGNPKEIFPLWPTSPMVATNSIGIQYGTFPSDLGEWVDDDAIRQRIRKTAPTPLETQLRSRGMRSLRVNVLPKKCGQSCVSPDDVAHPLNLGNFDGLITLRRNEEMEKALSSLFKNKVDIAAKLFLNLNIVMPPENLTLRWRGALSSKGNLALWLCSTWFGKNIFPSLMKSAQVGEKLNQIDTSLATVVASFPDTSERTALILAQQTGKAFNDSLYGKDFELIPGMALFAGNGSATASRVPTSQIEILQFLNSPATHAVAAAQNPVVVQDMNREFFLFTSGWIVLPISTKSNLSEKQNQKRAAFAHIPLTEMGSSFDRIEEIRRKYRIQSFHILAGGVGPTNPITLIFKQPEIIHECVSFKDTVTVAQTTNTAPQGDPQIQLSISSKDYIRSAKVVCIAEFSGNDNSPLDVLVQRNGVPARPDSIGVGEFSLNGSLFINPNGSGFLSLPTSGEFSPPAIPPQFSPKLMPEISVWMERFPHVSRRWEAQ